MKPNGTCKKLVCCINIALKKLEVAAYSDTYWAGSWTACSIVVNSPD